MGWFTEQIEERKRRDYLLLAEAYDDLNEAITGKRLHQEVYDDQKIMQNVLDEIRSFYHFKSMEIPKNITELNDKMEYVLRPAGIMWREIHLDKGWYKNAAGAMLLRLKEDGSYVALIPGKFSGYSFMDVKTGKRIWLNHSTEKLFNRRGYCFYMGFPQKKLGIHDLILYMAGSISRTTYGMILGLMALITLVGALVPRLTYILYTDVLESKSLRALLAIAVFFLCTAISTAMLTFVRNILSTRLDTQLNLSVQAATMQRIFSLSPTFFRQYSAGELANKMGSINSLCNAMVSGILSVEITSLFSLIYIAQIARYAKGLMLPAVLLTAITVLYSLLVTLLQIKVNRQLMEVSAKNSGMTYALITGIQKIRLSGSEKRAFSKWLKQYSREVSLQYHELPWLLTYRSDVSLTISVIGQIVLYYFAVQAKVTLAEYTAFTSAYGMVSGSFLSLVSVATSIAGIQPILKIAEPVLQAEPESSEKRTMVSRVSGNIELNNVSFRYTEAMPNVIDNVTLKIKSGQYIAIVGKTGCGKSTLVRLLLGFEKPQRGAIYYDGKDLARLDVKSLRQHIGTVLQDGKLFRGDIFSNITISAKGASLKDAWEVAERVGLAEDIRNMPMGMHTLITEGGGGISGGQRQRLLIARAIVSNPGILIFDEATSALDNITQKQVSAALDARKCTRIVIAHRLSTVKQCDRILYLEGGRIMEDGTYEELMEKNGKFAELVERQRLES